MPRSLSFSHRRLAEEAVRRGIAAAVVMEAAAREWIAAEGDEAFPDYLVRRAVLREEQAEALAAAVAGETEGEAPGDAGAGADGAKAPHPSEVVKGYRILERLGRGGMGSVYRAEQAGMNRTVALKILRRPFGEQEEHVERLQREARLVGSLDHANIVRGLDVGRHGPYHYFAMEFVEGETLRDLLKKRGVVPEAEALRIVEGICLALDHAHSRGVVHRDVKPGNIMITPEGTPKLTDYGLAKGPADFTLTQSGVTIGTPQYISPEQAHDPAGVDIQTDLYALGATAYHMLTGIPPHTSDTLAGLLTKVLYEKPRTARQVNPKVSAGASFLVEKMMAKQRKHRYRTPREVLRDLRSLAAGKSIVPRDWAGDFEVHEVRRKYRLAIAAAAMLAVLAAGATVLFQYRAERERRRALDAESRGIVDEILRGEFPRSRQVCEERREALERFIRKTEYLDTQAHLLARREKDEAQRHIDSWLQAEAFRNDAEKRFEQGRKLNQAAAFLEGELDGIRKKMPYGREPASWLLEEIRGIRESGRAMARAEVKRRLEEVERAAPVEGAARGVQSELASARDRCYADFLAEADLPDFVQELDEVLQRLRFALAEIEDTELGAGYREKRDRALREADFAAVEEELDKVARRIAANPKLQDVLGRIPAPAAADLRGRTGWEYGRVREENGRVLEKALEQARAMEAAGNWDGAQDWLEQAERHSVRELREPVAKERREIAGRRAEAEKKDAARVQEFFTAWFQDIARRDYAGAERRIVASGGPGPAGPRLSDALVASRFVLILLDAHAFEPLRRRIRDRGEFPLGLRFEEETRQPHPQVSNVRLKDTDTGQVVVFDAPNLPNLQGTFHKLSLPLLLAYAGLDAQGLEAPQALARAVLVLAEGESFERRAVEDVSSQLRLLGDRMPQAGAAIGALLDRADALVESKIQAEKDQEVTAARYYDDLLKALQIRDGKEALRILDVLFGTGSLNRTRFVQERRDQLNTLKGQATVMAQDRRLLTLWPNARIAEPAPGNPASDGLTKALWRFDQEGPYRDFVPPEDGGEALYRIFLDPPGPDGNGGPPNGRLLFREGGPARNLADSPLVVECPFRPRQFIAVSFTWRSEDPLYLQVSIVGNHVGVLTDDGRKTGGRGVYAWQSYHWQDPDRSFPPLYRRDALPKDPARVKVEEGWRHFQFEPDTSYQVRVEWDRGRLKLLVDGREVWNAALDNKYMTDTPPRIRIVSYTRGWIDDLSVEGVVDKQHLTKLLK